MDMASHALIGLTLYQTRRSRFPQYEPAVFWAAMIGSEMPDFDIIYYLEGSMAFLLNHRGMTHSIPGLTIMSAVLTYLVRQRYSSPNYSTIFKWAFSASLLHVFLDALNTWGTKVLFPFDNQWIALDILPFFDIPLILLCTISLLCGYCVPVNSRRYAITALCVFFIYIGGRGLLHEHLVHEVLLQYTANPIQKVSVLPTVNPLHWQTIIETKTSVQLAELNALDGHMNYTAWYPTYEDPLLSKVRSDVSVSQVLPFFRYPTLSLQHEAGKSTVTISDLYFGTNSDRRATFELKHDGSVVQKYKAHRVTLPAFQ